MFFNSFIKFPGVIGSKNSCRGMGGGSGGSGGSSSLLVSLLVSAELFGMGTVRLISMLYGIFGLGNPAAFVLGGNFFTFGLA